jgi:hypothetical protein
MPGAPERREVPLHRGEPPEAAQGAVLTAERDPMAQHRPAQQWAPTNSRDADRFVAALQRWAARVGQPPRGHEWSPSLAESIGYRNVNVEKWEREHPAWPSATTVAAHHGLEWTRFCGRS